MLHLAPQTHLLVLKASLLPLDLQLHRTFPSHLHERRLCWALVEFWLSPGGWALVLGALQAHLLEIRDFCRLWGFTAGRAAVQPFCASSVPASKKLRKAQMAGAASPGVSSAQLPSQAAPATSMQGGTQGCCMVQAGSPACIEKVSVGKS